MSVLSLERRLRKVEAAHGRQGADTFFLVWAKDDEDEAQARADLGRTIRPDYLWIGRWPSADRMPPRPRWVSVKDLIDEELSGLVDDFEMLAAEQERANAVARGEDVTALDETDFRIRGMRKVYREPTLSWSLRMLMAEAVPDPVAHPGPCHCPTCETGETRFIVAHRRTDAARRVWAARYLPDDSSKASAA